MTVIQRTKYIRTLCEDKKGVDPIILDVRKMSDITSYYVVVSGNSSPHVRALADHIVHETKKKGDKPWHVEKTPEAKWIVVDYGDIIVHVFYHETRAYYNLEELWHDAPHIK